MNTLKQNKAIIRSFMRSAYTDAKLVELLDHARSGKLAFLSCCCFIGIPTATHELRGQNMGRSACHDNIQHYFSAEYLTGAGEAEESYNQLANGFGISGDEERDDLRRLRLIPMVLAEVRRRAKVSQPVEKREEVGA